jgi:hypothetical protein
MLSYPVLRNTEIDNMGSTFRGFNIKITFSHQDIKGWCIFTSTPLAKIDEARIARGTVNL